MSVESFGELENMRSWYERYRDELANELDVFNRLKLQYIQTDDPNIKHHLRITLYAIKVRIKLMLGRLRKQIKMMRTSSPFGEGLAWGKDDEPIGMGTLKL